MLKRIQSIFKKAPDPAPEAWVNIHLGYGPEIFDSRETGDERETMFSQRVCAFAAGVSGMVMWAFGVVAVGNAINGQIQDWITILGTPFFGLYSIYLMGLSHQYGGDLLREIAFQRDEAWEARQISEAFAERIIVMTRTALAAVPAQDEDYSPSTEIIPFNGNGWRH